MNELFMDVVFYFTHLCSCPLTLRRCCELLRNEGHNRDSRSSICTGKGVFLLLRFGRRRVVKGGALQEKVI
jgi:hypothetical protein